MGGTIPRVPWRRSWLQHVTQSSVAFDVSQALPGSAMEDVGVDTFGPVPANIRLRKRVIGIAQGVPPAKKATAARSTLLSSSRRWTLARNALISSRSDVLNAPGPAPSVTCRPSPDRSAVLAGRERRHTPPSASHTRPTPRSPSGRPLLRRDVILLGIPVCSLERKDVPRFPGRFSVSVCNSCI